MIRKRCVAHGHRWSSWGQTALPLQFCGRWFCAGERVAPWVPEPLATALRRSVEAGQR